MNETTPLLAGQEESKPPSDDDERFTELLEILSQPRYWYLAQTRINCERAFQLAKSHLYKNAAEQRAMIRKHGAVGMTCYVPRYHFGDDCALTGEQLVELAGQEKLATLVCRRLLDAPYSAFAEAYRLLKKVSPELLTDWPPSGVAELVKLPYEMAAQRMRSILVNFLSSRQNGNQHGDSPEGEVSQPAAPQPIPQPSVLKPVVQLRGMTLKPMVCGVEVEELSEPYYLVIKALLEAGPDGMKKSELSEIKADGPKYLRNLSEQPEWNGAIRMAVKAHRRYAIIHK